MCWEIKHYFSLLTFFFFLKKPLQNNSVEGSDWKNNWEIRTFKSSILESELFVGTVTWPVFLDIISKKALRKLNIK